MWYLYVIISTSALADIISKDKKARWTSEPGIGRRVD